MNHPDICNRILDIIAKDEGLVEQFASGLEIDKSEFDDFLNTTEVSLTINPQERDK